MHMVTVTIAMLLVFQVKHFVADYLLQPGWVLRGKGDLRQPADTFMPACMRWARCRRFSLPGWASWRSPHSRLAEFVIHFTIDHTKARLSRDSKSGPNTRAYWAMHGADQLMHQLTYAGLIYAALALTSAGIP